MKFGYFGTGYMAKIMAKTMVRIPEVELYAVSSRDTKRAELFAKENGFHNFFGSYEEMVNDSEIELVYIATPHALHYEQIKLCLEHNKSVICEKAFTGNAKQAAEVINLAHKKNVFLVEAFWPRFLPIQETIQKILKSGIIGKTTMLCAHIGGAIDRQDRITNPSLAGGALLDIGLYPISFALLCFGNNVSDVSGIADISKTGVDIQDNITLRWEDGKMAALSCSCRAHTDKTGTIWGTQGYVIVDNINNPKTVTIYNSNHEIVTTHYAPEQISGYEYEIMAAMQSIKEGKLECEQMPHKETIHVLEIADKLRSSWGVCYPFDN